MKYTEGRCWSNDRFEVAEGEMPESDAMVKKLIRKLLDFGLFVTVRYSP